MGPNMVDGIDCDNLFDQIDDLMDFPPDSECGNLVGSSDGFPDIPTWNDALPDCHPFCSASDLSAELSVPIQNIYAKTYMQYEDIVQLEWLSTFVEDSFSNVGLTIGKDTLCMDIKPSANHFHASSPVSVLESSSSTTTTTTSSSSGNKTKPPLNPNHRGTQRARSKRPRPPTFNPRSVIQLISPSSSVGAFPQHPSATARRFSSETHSFVESPPITEKKQKKASDDENRKSTTRLGSAKKKTKIKITAPADPFPTPHRDSSVRKCLHCEITTTPQWRAGPMGPKTLCNACGVRYKSGRLFPEYRPAASPTFVPSLHSNSHKKVAEMRSKAGPGECGE
ncbi:hypothetical protein OROMI_001377 [Orobanche minor]